MRSLGLGALKELVCIALVHYKRGYRISAMKSLCLILVAITALGTFLSKDRLRDFIQLKGGFNAKEISFENVDGGNPHNDCLWFTGRNFLTAGRRR